MMGRRRRFTPEFKAQVVLEVISGRRTAAEICRQHKIKPQLLSEWKGTFLANAANAFQGEARLREAEARMAQQREASRCHEAGASVSSASSMSGVGTATEFVLLSPPGAG